MADQPQIIQFEGTTHYFPADFTPEEISTALRQSHPRPGPAVPGAERTGLPGIAAPPNVLRQRAQELAAAEQTLKQTFAPDTRGFGESFADQIKGLNPIPAIDQWLFGPKTIASLPAPEGRITDVPVAAPVATAAGQAAQGNIPGAIGTLVSGVPAQALLIALGTKAGRQAVAKLPGDVALKLPPQVLEKLGKATAGTVGGVIGHATGIPGAEFGGVWLGKELGAGLGDAWERVQTAIRTGRTAEAKAALDRLTSSYSSKGILQAQAEAQAAAEAAAAQQPAEAQPAPAAEQPAVPSLGAPTPDYEAMFRQQSAPLPVESTPIAAAAEETKLLDDIARGTAGKPFAKLDANGQATVRAIASRLGVNRAEAAPAAAAQAPEPQPTPAEAATATPAPAAATPQPTVEELSRQINESLASDEGRVASGEPETPQPKRNFAAEARAKRAADAQKLGDYLIQKGYTSDQLKAFNHREQWRPHATAAGVDTPTPKGAQAVIDYVKGREAAISTITKEPWQMTRQEFIDSYPARTRQAVAEELQQKVPVLEEQIARANASIAQDPNNPANGAIGKYISDTQAAIDAQKARLSAPIPDIEQVWSPEQIRWHHVEYALRQGKPVSPEVLADYPELQPTAPAAKPTKGKTPAPLTEAQRARATAEAMRLMRERPDAY